MRKIFLLFALFSAHLYKSQTGDWNYLHLGDYNIALTTSPGVTQVRVNNCILLSKDTIVIHITATEKGKDNRENKLEQLIVYDILNNKELATHNFARFSNYSVYNRTVYIVNKKGMGYDNGKSKNDYEIWKLDLKDLSFTKEFSLFDITGKYLENSGLANVAYIRKLDILTFNNYVDKLCWCLNIKTKTLKFYESAVLFYDEMNSNGNLKLVETDNEKKLKISDLDINTFKLYNKEYVSGSEKDVKTILNTKYIPYYSDANYFFNFQSFDNDVYKAGVANSLTKLSITLNGLGYPVYTADIESKVVKYRTYKGYVPHNNRELMLDNFASLIKLKNKISPKFINNILFTWNQQHPLKLFLNPDEWRFEYRDTANLRELVKEYKSGFWANTYYDKDKKSVHLNNRIQENRMLIKEAFSWEKINEKLNTIPFETKASPLPVAFYSINNDKQYAFFSNAWIKVYDKTDASKLCYELDLDKYPNQRNTLNPNITDIYQIDSNRVVINKRGSIYCISLDNFTITKRLVVKQFDTWPEDIKLYLTGGGKYFFAHNQTSEILSLYSLFPLKWIQDFPNYQALEKAFVTSDEKHICLINKKYTFNKWVPKIQYDLESIDRINPQKRKMTLETKISNYSMDGNLIFSKSDNSYCKIINTADLTFTYDKYVDNNISVRWLITKNNDSLYVTEGGYLYKRNPPQSYFPQLDTKKLKNRSIYFLSAIEKTNKYAFFFNDYNTLYTARFENDKFIIEEENCKKVDSEGANNIEPIVMKSFQKQYEENAAKEAAAQKEAKKQMEEESERELAQKATNEANKCERCQGKGFNRSLKCASSRCKNGLVYTDNTGSRYSNGTVYTGRVQTQSTCNECEGRGFWICPDCRGTGRK